jgi:hypothetical protein
MSNQSSSIYGLTILSPIREDSDSEIPHNVAIRAYLAALPRDQRSPFAHVSSTHMARLAVLDDVAYSGIPAFGEYLATQYLVFEANFDGDLGVYLARMAQKTPRFVDSLWKHCVGYPGVADVRAFVDYMRKCQVESTFYFADVNDKTVDQTLCALQTQRSVSAFILENQGKRGVELQKAFVGFLRSLGHTAPAKLGAAVERF